MELYGLDCVDLVVSYTIQFIFIAKKCKFSKNHLYPPLAASNRYGLTDCYTKTKTFVKRKGLFKMYIHIESCRRRKRLLHSAG